MTKEKAIESFLAGDPLMCVEYRGSKAEVIKWRDKETRRPMEGTALRHTVENNAGSIAVNERTDENFNVANYHSPFTKGQKVLLRVTGLQVQRGSMTCSGTLEVLEETASVKPLSK